MDRPGSKKADFREPVVLIRHSLEKDAEPPRRPCGQMIATEGVHSWAYPCHALGQYEAKLRSAHKLSSVQPRFSLVPSLAHTILLS